MDYSLETLIETFKEHALEVENWDRKVSKEQGIDYKESFSISMALHVICKEIVSLKKKNADGK